MMYSPFSMWLKQLAQRCFPSGGNRRRQTSRVRSSVRRRFRPCLEYLEDRTLLNATWYVAVGGSGNGTSAGNPLGSIQTAIDDASSGDTIIVAAGTYAEKVTINVNNLTIEGANTGVNPVTGTRGAESIVTGAGNDGDTPFYVTADDDTIDGFTVEDATNNTVFGCGILLSAGTYGSHIVNNIITDNIVGIDLANNSSTDQTVIQDNLIENNNASGSASGTGIYSDQSVAGGTLQNVLIDSNSFIGNDTAGIGFSSTDTNEPATEITISNNIFNGNVQGMYAFNLTSSSITDNTFENSTSIGGISGDITLLEGSSGVSITNNLMKNGACYALEISNADTGAPAVTDITFSENSISGYTGVSGVVAAIDAAADYNGTLDLSGNWWDTAVGANPSDATAPTAINSLVSGPVMIGSFLDSGDNAATGTGFTPVSTTEMWVPETAATSGLTHVSGDIQAGIDTALSDMTVRVAADSYVANSTDNPGGLYVDKPITLLGSQAGVDARTRTGAETVILPSRSDPNPNDVNSQIVVYVASNNVTIDGFTIDGDNPNLITGVVYNGADIDAAEGIVSYDGVGNITVQNNIVRNTSYTGIDFYNYNNSGEATSNNLITQNLIENVGGGNYGYGIGVLLYNNFYADVTNNVMSTVRVGVQTGNFFQANPGGTGTAEIAGNQIKAVRTGIFYNLHYEDASPFTVDNNSISAVVDSTSGTKWDGILISSQQNAVSATFQDNTIDGSTAAAASLTTAGYEVWNTPTTGTLLISGGSVKDVDYGVWVNTYEGYGPSDAAATQVTVSGLNVNANQIGVYVEDSAANTSHPAASATIEGNTAISTSGTGTGIEVSGANASALIENNDSTISDNLVGIDDDGGTVAIKNNTIADNGTGVQVENGGNLTSLTQNFLTNNTGDGLLIYFTAGTIAPVYDNDLSGNGGYAVDNKTNTAVIASGNWWGSNLQTGVTAEVNGNVNVAGWLGDGTDTQPTTPGFQGDFTPSITSADQATFQFGVSGPTFTITTAGDPSPSLSISAGSLPNGLSFLDNGDGTASISGTPTGNAGTYTFTITANNGVTPDATQNFTLTVNKANATVSLSNLTQTYTGSALAPTAATTPTGLTVDLTYTQNGQPVANPTNAGTYEVTATIDDPNYQGSTTGTFTIKPAPLTISAVTETKTYDGTTNSSDTPTISGVQGTDTVTGLSQAFASKNALGANDSTLEVTGYTINDGNGGANYTVTTKTATGTITPAPLTISAVTETKTYDGTTNSSATPTFSGVQDTDTVTGLSQAFASKNALGANDSTLEVTAYTINDGNGGANYTVTTNTASGTIAKANAIIVVNGYNVVSDGNAHTATGSATGVQGESLTGLNLSSTTHTNVSVYQDGWNFIDTTGNYNNSAGQVIDTISTVSATSISATSGTPQSALVGTSFTSPLVATVRDQNGTPLEGASVTFTAPGNGASGTFSNGFSNISGTTDGNGQVLESFTANSTTGAYTVTASVAGVTTPASFSLTNTAAPSVTLSSSAPNPTNAAIPVSVTFSENVTGFGAGDVSVTNGTVSGFTGSGSSYSFTVVPFGQGLVTVQVAAGVAHDTAGNGNTASNILLYTYNSTATVTNVTTTATNGTYGTHATIFIEVVFNQAVIVSGTPQLALSSGGTANYSGGNGTNTLTFTYIVAAGNTTNGGQLDYTSSNALTLNAGTIQNAGGVAANLTLASPGSAGSLSANTNIVINTLVAVVPSAPTTSPQPPVLHMPPLVAFINGILGGTEMMNANGTVTVTYGLYGFTLLAITYDNSGNLVSAAVWGITLPNWVWFE